MKQKTLFFLCGNFDSVLVCQNFVIFVNSFETNKRNPWTMEYTFSNVDYKKS